MNRRTQKLMNLFFVANTKSRLIDHVLHHLHLFDEGRKNRYLLCLCIDYMLSTLLRYIIRILFILVDNEVRRKDQFKRLDTRSYYQPSSRRTKNLGKSQSKCPRAGSGARQLEEINVEISINVTHARIEFTRE